jgi:hypothetical protein
VSKNLILAPLAAVVLALLSPMATANWDWTASSGVDPGFNVTDPNYAYWYAATPPGFKVEHDDSEALHVAAWKNVGSFDDEFEVFVAFDNVFTGLDLGIYLAEPGFDHLDPNVGDADYIMTLFGTSLLRGNTLGWGSKHDGNMTYQETYPPGHPADGERYAVQFGRTSNATLYADFLYWNEGRTWEVIEEQEWTDDNPTDTLTDLYLVSDVVEGRFFEADYNFTDFLIVPEPGCLLLILAGSVLIRRR